MGPKKRVPCAVIRHLSYDHEIQLSGVGCTFVEETKNKQRKNTENHMRSGFPWLRLVIRLQPNSHNLLISDQHLSMSSLVAVSKLVLNLLWDPFLIFPLVIPSWPVTLALYYRSDSENSRALVDGAALPAVDTGFPPADVEVVEIKSDNVDSTDVTAVVETSLV